MIWAIFGLVSIILVLLLKHKNKTVITIGIFSLFFVAINSLIYALSPGRSGFVPIIDSRNLYLPSIGMVFLIVSLSMLIKPKILSILFLSVFISFNVIITKIELNKITDVGKDRFKILKQIDKENVKFLDKQILYVESNTSYYGLPDEIRIPPFQSGFGQTLLVWFQDNEKFPIEFFENKFLWPIESQGYKEINGRGFGYFRELDLLTETIKEYNLPEDSFTAYSWNSKENKLTNITNEIRKKLTK